MKQIRNQRKELQLSDEYQEGMVLRHAGNAAIKYPVNIGTSESMKNVFPYINDPVFAVYQKGRKYASMAVNERVHIIRQKSKNMEESLLYIYRRAKLLKKEFYNITDTFEYFNQNPFGTYSKLLVK